MRFDRIDVVEMHRIDAKRSSGRHDQRLQRAALQVERG